MRKFFAAALLLVGYTCFAQCTFTVTLKNKGSLCLGSDTLVVSSANKLFTIKWYKNGVLDTTVNSITTQVGNGITVAGGNGVGKKANQIDNAVAVWVDAGGYVYAIDYNNQRIQKFPPNSTSATNGITVAGGNGAGSAANQFDSPQCIFFDLSGNMYIADHGNHRIQKFPPGSTSATNGVTVAGGNGQGSAANQLNNPNTVFVDASGYIYVADASNNRIQKFPPNATSATNGVTVAGGQGAGGTANQLNVPVHMYVDVNGYMYVADWQNSRIQKFPPGSVSGTNGVTIAGGNGAGSAANQLAAPCFVYVDGNGNVYIVDEYNNRIQKFPPNSTSTTNGITVAGGNGSGANANQFFAPTSLFIDGNNLYVSDAGNNRIQKFSFVSTTTIDTTRIPTTAGTYQAKVTDASGCTVESNFITVYPVVTPTVTIENSGQSTSACTVSNNFSFSALITDGSYVNTPAYQWQVNGVNAGVNNRTFTSNFADKDVVTCIYTSGAGCPTPPTVTSNSYVIALAAPSAAALKIKGSVCLGKDTLVISSTNKLASIRWYKDGLVDTTLIGKIIAAGKALTVAGGLGSGSASNQIGATGVFVHTDGNIYVGDGINSRVIKFPANSSIGTNGTVVAGGNGLGAAINQFQSPNGMCIDKNGYLYVVDNSDRVRKFPPGSTSATNGITVAGGNGIGSAANQLNFPRTIAIDANDNIYVADWGNNRIQKFLAGSTSATNGITVAGGNGAGAAANQLNGPYSVSIDANGNLFVGDNKNNRVQKFAAGSTSATNGTTVAGGNGTGSAANQIGPYNTALDQYGNLYVGDLSNYRVLEFPAGSSSATNGITVMGGNGYGPAANQLSFVAGVAVDSAGNIYGADDLNRRIQKSAPILSIIDPSRIPTTPGTYYAVVTDTTGCSITTNSITVYAPTTPTMSISTLGGTSVCSASNNLTFTASTTNSGTVPSFQWQVNGKNVGTNDSTFTNSFANNDVVTCTLTSNAVCATVATVASNTYTVKIGTPPVALLKSKPSVCLDFDTLYVSASNTPSSIAWYNGGVLDTIIKATVLVNPNGITMAGGNGIGSAANQLGGPMGLYVDSVGNIYEADYNNPRIQKFPFNSTSLTNGVTVAGSNNPGSAPNQLSYPESVFFDKSGNLYVCDKINYRVQRFPPNSTSATNGTTIIGGTGFGTALNQLNNPTSIFLDGSDNIFVADVGNVRIQKFPAGSVSGTSGKIVAGGTGIGSTANQLYEPTSVFVDGGGNIFVADTWNNRIQKFPPNATVGTNGVTVAGGNINGGAAANELNHPNSVFVDGSGNIYVTDTRNHRIQKFPANSVGGTNAVTVAGGNGNGFASNQLDSPSFVWIDLKGNIYVSDFANFRIQKFLATTIIDTTYLPTAPGTYTAIITDNNGCSVTTNAITISPVVKPSVNIIANKTGVCAGSAMVFTAIPTNAIPTPFFIWQVNGKPEGPNNAVFNAILSSGDAVSCIISNGISCAAADTSNIIYPTIKPLPVVGPANNVSISIGQSVTLNMPVTGNISTYLWNPPIYLSSNTIVNPLATPEKTTVYTLKVTSVDSCEASGTITVTVIAPISIATAFTPNGDGRNDVFYVLGGLNGDKIKDFSIFDRWGKRLFQVQNVLPNDRNFGWNGTYNGELQQQGSYVYVVTIASASGKEQSYKGSVVLVR